MAHSNGAFAPLNGHSLATGFSPSARELNALLDSPAESQAVVDNSQALAPTRVSKSKTPRKKRLNAAGEPLPPLPRNPFNALQQRELELTERVCLSAKRTDYAPFLEKWGVADSDADELLLDVRAARGIATGAQSSTNVRKDATGEADKAKIELCILFRVVQSAARKMFIQQRPNHLNDYGIGLAPDSRTRIEQIYDGILTQLQSDTLPGIDADWIAGFRQSYAAWKAPQESQSDAQVNATNARFERNSLVGDILARRRLIQIAANAIWPPRPENHAVRREFGLPPARNYAPKS